MIQEINTKDVLEWFEAHYLPEPNSGCWLWIGTLNSDGYGEVNWVVIGGRDFVHRISWRLFRGPLANGEQVLHSCDTRCCVNPDHLYKGNHKINMLDRNAKNRQAKGERHGRAKLSEAQVIAIINDPRTQYEIARDYSVTRTQVSLIKSGKSWKHVSH
jgi:hypothetical protein